MKILLTGGGSGGHFFPLIAITEAIYEIAEEERLLQPEIILASDLKYNKQMISQEAIVFKKIYSGKMRRYFSFLNFIDLFKTFAGILRAIWIIYSHMPDVVFGKGGNVSFPILLAARIFDIPVMIHESDSVPGRVNRWAGKFAKKIAISFESAIKFFPEEKTALTGVPVRKSILGFTPEEGKEIFNLEESTPVILVIGGSQGSKKINDVVVDISKELVKSFQVIHQSGRENEKETKERITVSLEDSLFSKRYYVYPYLEDSLLRNAAGVSSLVISRGGATAIYEIAAWGLPSIIIPLEGSAQDHQKENAYNYARSGAARVIEEKNLLPQILHSEIQKILNDEKKMEQMENFAKSFAKPDAARKIAWEIIKLSLENK